MIEFTLYGQMYGSPIVRMSVWPSTVDELLAVDVLGRDLVHRLDLAGLHATSSGAAPRSTWKILRASRGGSALERLRRAEERGPVRGRPLPLALRSRKSNGVGNVSVLSVVSIWKTLTPASRRTLPIRQFDVCSSLRVLVHERLRLCCIVCDVVVVAQAAVRGQAGGGRLPAAVHRDEVDVDVDEQVATRPPAC